MKILKISFAIILVVLIISLVVLDFYVHDFRTVIPNQVYRSAQLSTAQFQATINKYHIKSIVNLRGINAGSNWYTDELAISTFMHVNHYNVALDSSVLPSTANFKKLVSILQTAPRPILIHCESGVDRSGLAAAVILLLGNHSLNTAAKQVSWKYFVLTDDSVGKQFLQMYEKWLAANHLTTSKENLLRWLAQYHYSN